MTPTPRVSSTCRSGAQKQADPDNRQNPKNLEELFLLLDLTATLRIPTSSTRRKFRTILSALKISEADESRGDIEVLSHQSSPLKLPPLRTEGKVKTFFTCKRSGKRRKMPVRELAWLIIIALYSLFWPAQPGFAQSTGPTRPELIGECGSIIFGTCNPVKSAFLIDPYLQADALRKEGKNDEALRAVNEAIRQDPNRGEAYALRSGILGNLQQNEGGVADGDLGIRLSKTSKQKAMAAYNKGFNLTSLNRKHEALEAFKLALTFDPTYAPAHFGRGKVFYYLGMWRESKAELDQLLFLTPKQGAAWAYRAEDLFKLGMSNDGMESAEKAVNLTPNDPRAFRARAVGHLHSREYEAMLGDATRAVELDPSRPLAHLLRGRALGLLGRLDEALAEYALEPDKKAVEPYINGIHRELYGTRMYNCGDPSTDFEISGGPRIDIFASCKDRVIESLQEIALPVLAPLPPRRKVTGLPGKPSTKK